jgi:hypothetical protein
VGASYTDRVDASEVELNDRIPLSIARWHQHINFAKHRQDGRLDTPALTQNSACWVPPPLKKLVRQLAVSLPASTRVDGPRLPV